MSFISIEDGGPDGFLLDIRICQFENVMGLRLLIERPPKRYMELLFLYLSIETQDSITWGLNITLLTYLKYVNDQQISCEVT